TDNCPQTFPEPFPRSSPVVHLPALLSPVQRCVSSTRRAALRRSPPAPRRSDEAAAPRWAHRQSRGRGVAAGGWRWEAPGDVLRIASTKVFLNFLFVT